MLIFRIALKMNNFKKILLVTIQTIAIFVFAAGYFQLRPSSTSAGVGKRDEGLKDLEPADFLESLQKPENPIYDNIVFVVLDALRADFVYDKKRFPRGFSWLRQTVDSSDKECHGVAMVGLARAPTVTLPRLKALTAGISPVFFDFFRNLMEGSKETERMTVDTWVDQLRGGRRERVLFIGDNTWTRLFPDPEYFHPKSAAVRSFLVTDTVTVDTDVTERLDMAFSDDDWKVLILHYLGIDHVGHVGGVNCPLMMPKFEETDANLKRVYESILDRDSRLGTKTLMVVLGDHGMTDGGNHGGSTAAEIEAGLMFISSLHGPSWDEDGPSKPPKVVNQVDLATTLALLAGGCSPKSSSGRFIKDTLPKNIVSPSNLAFFLASSAIQLYKNLDNAHKSALDRLFTSAKEAHINNEFSKAITLYEEFSVEASRILVESAGEYEISKLLVAICITSYCVLTALRSRILESRNSYCEFILLASVSLSFINMIPSWVPLLLAALPLGYELNFIWHLARKSSSTSPFLTLRKVFYCLSKDDAMFIVITAAYCALQFATSYMQEEHEFWNFLYTSLLFADIAVDFIRQTGDVFDYFSFRNKRLQASLGVLLLFRSIRHWNTTGINNEGFPDMKVFLGNHVSLMRLLLGGSIALIIYTGYPRGHPKKNSTGYALKVFHGLFLFLLKCDAVDSSTILKTVFAEKIIFEQFTLATGVIMLVLNQFDRSSLALALMMIQKPHNAFPMTVLYLLTRFEFMGFFHHFPLASRIVLMHASFFLLGPCHMIASIDFSPAYIGQRDFIPALIGFLGFTSIWAGPILTFTSLSPSREEGAFERIFLWRSTAHLFLVIWMLINMHHSFVWVVFAPRLLFELGWTLFYLLPYAASANRAKSVWGKV